MQDLFAGYEPYVAIAIVALLFATFLSERYPPAVTAAGGAAVFLMFGFVTPEEAMRTFGNSAPITIGAMFILSGALVRTGVLEQLADLVITRAQVRPSLAIAVALLTAVVASAFVNNTPLVLVLIPIFIRLSKAIGISPTRLLIPLSYAAILGGTCSLIGTSTNLLVDGVARGANMAPFGIFEITPVGIVAAATGTLVMLLLGPRLLPHREVADEAVAQAESEFLSEVTLRSGERYAGKKLANVPEFNRSGIRVVGLRRGDEIIRDNVGDTKLRSGDTLILRATSTELLTLDDREGVRIGLRRGPERSPGGVAVEAILVPRRAHIGRRLIDLALGPRFGIRVLGAHRPRHIPGRDLENVRLRPGDKLLLNAPAENFGTLVEETDLVAVTQSAGRAYRRGKAPIAVFALLAVVGLAAFSVMDIGGLAMIAVAAILLLRCIDADEAWQSIDGSIIVLIIAMLVVGVGLDKTGAVQLIVDLISPLILGYPPVVGLIAVYLIASVFTEIVTNNAVAIILTPIAIGLAVQLGVDPRAFVVAVMFGASASFSTPIGYQTNTLVYGAGNYRFADFLKIGIPMNISVGIASCTAIYFFLGL